jgi:hypothetical protein
MQLAVMRSTVTEDGWFSRRRGHSASHEAFLLLPVNGHRKPLLVSAKYGLQTTVSCDTRIKTLLLLLWRRAFNNEVLD